jgi:hypothetical protein
VGATERVERGNALAVRDGAVYLAGSMHKTPNLPGGHPGYTHAEKTVAFVAKLDAASGTKAWIDELSTYSTNSFTTTEFTGVGVDEAGNIYASGQTEGDFGGKNLDRSGQYLDVMLSSWKPDGARVYSRQWGAPSFFRGVCSSLPDGRTHEVSTGLAVSGTQTFLCGTEGGPNFTAPGPNRSFVLENQ